MKQKNCEHFPYLWYFPYDNRTICTTWNDEFATWTETTRNNAGRMCYANADLNGRLIIPQLHSPKWTKETQSDSNKPKNALDCSCTPH